MFTRSTSGSGSLFQRYEDLKERCEASPQGLALIKQIREQILPQKTIFIDNALCLGLGTMEGGSDPPFRPSTWATVSIPR
jgi:hypothetical protein